MKKSKIFRILFLFGFLILSFNTFAINFSYQKTNSWLDQLNKNESFSITLTSQGCFNSYQEIISVERIEDDYFINWNDKCKKMSKKDKDLFNWFETKLNELKTGSCTTINIYTIKYKNQITQITDGNCSSFGFDFLKNEILNIN